MIFVYLWVTWGMKPMMRCSTRLLPVSQPSTRPRSSATKRPTRPKVRPPLWQEEILLLAFATEMTLHASNATVLPFHLAYSLSCFCLAFLSMLAAFNISEERKLKFIQARKKESRKKMHSNWQWWFSACHQNWMRVYCAGFGFASFGDPIEGAKALREMDGKYIGNRPCKLRKSSWQVNNLASVAHLGVYSETTTILSLDLSL